MNLEDLYRLLRSEHVQAQGIVDTLEEPLLVLDQSGSVLTANRGFYETFRVSRDDTVGVACSTLATVNGTSPNSGAWWARSFPSRPRLSDTR
ncbi:PAS domain-containing protein [Bradyrhizobium sp. CB2312]|nr:PAS domain-containing protein [Bradyrhizobium sp. CB2312]WFU69191.1 PAS domain-containing protein [Bradyrhizobium sp. CB2312]